jgi:hypothetical protein
VPNDAKLGLVAGVAIVLLVAVVFYRDEAGVALPLSTGNGVAANQTGTPIPSSVNPVDQQPARAKPTVQIQAIEGATGASKQPAAGADDLE